MDQVNNKNKSMESMKTARQTTTSDDVLRRKEGNSALLGRRAQLRAD